MHDIFRRTTKIKIPGSQKHQSFIINWQIVFYIVLIASLILAGFFILKMSNKKIIAQYDQEILQQQNQLKENYQKILEKSEKSNNKLILQGVELIDKNQIEFGCMALEEAIKRDTDIRDANIYAGYGFLRLAQKAKKQESKKTRKQEYLEKAKQYLEKALDIDPIHSLTYQLLASVYFELGDAELAQICYNKANELAY